MRVVRWHVGRRLGQHFLRASAVEQLTRLIAPGADETFLEIGPGRGALTFALAERAARVVAVELDERLASELRSRVPPRVEVISGDALKVDLAALAPPGARLAGNLPYFASSPLLRRALGLRGHVRDAHLMVQKEVAERVAAGPGSKAYGVLSVFFAVWSDVDVPLEFPPGAFSPPPRVRSAVLRVRYRATPRAEVPDWSAFEQLVLASFARRRRTLENNLEDSYPDLKEHLRLLHIEGSRRAETLCVEEFANLAQVLGRPTRLAGESGRSARSRNV